MNTNKHSTIFEVFLYFIFLVKLVFLITIVLSIEATRKGNATEVQKYVRLKEQLHNLFTISMGILLLILFNTYSTPREVIISGHTKIFLFLFGIMSILGVVQTTIKE